MADVIAITTASGAPLPDALTLLPHDVQVGSGGSGHFGFAEADLVLIDARESPAQARDLCQRVRAESELPVLLLVGETTLTMLQRSWGMDDFVLESATAGEFDARIRTLVASAGKSSVYSSGPVRIDETAYTAEVDGQRLNLTYTEFELLKYLVSHPGRVLTRAQLLTEVWGYDYFGGTRTVDVHVRRLRAKLGPEHEGHIATVRNVGYRFSAHREH